MIDAEIRYWFHADPNELTLSQIYGLMSRLPHIIHQLFPATSHREVVERRAALKRDGDQELERWLKTSSRG